MKYTIKILAFICFVLTLQSCYEDYKSDYTHTTAYFARQKPLRTLLDDGKDMSFTFGTCLAGVYKNEKVWNVYYEVQPDLLNDYPDKELLPEDYYTLSDNNHIVVPKGKILGEIKVNINKEKFMNDPKGLNGTYVLPVKITSSDMDEILENKEYSLIALKYYNKYHGTYFFKGVDTKYDAAGNEIDKVEYNSDDLVKNNRIHELVTMSANSVKVPCIGRFNAKDYFMELSVDKENKVSFGSLAGSKIVDITGNGNFSYDGKNHPHFMLNYNYIDEEGLKHSVSEELIFIKTVLKMELW